MKYVYRLQQEIEAIQFKGDGVADLIILENFLGVKPDIVYFENGGKPKLRIINSKGYKHYANLSDFIIRKSADSFIVISYKTFMRLFEAKNEGKAAKLHENNLIYSLSHVRKEKKNKKWIK